MHVNSHEFVNIVGLDSVFSQLFDVE